MANSTNVKVNGHTEDVLIAILGSKGAGKSSFVKYLVGNTSVDIRDEVQVVRCTDIDQSGRSVMLLDTQGFDDLGAGITDTDILKKVSAFLLEQYGKERKLNGLVYVQRVVGGTFFCQSHDNLKMFKDLCGTETYKNVVVLTTFWDQISTMDEGARREELLKSRFLKELVEGSASFMRYDHTLESARCVLRHIFTLPGDQVQKDIAVGPTATSHKSEVESIREEMKRIRYQLQQQGETILELTNDMNNAKTALEEVKQEVAEHRKACNLPFHHASSQDKLASDGAINEHQNDVVIAVMGSTGTGKSSFIKLISGDTTVRVGDSLMSETSEIQVVRFVDPNSSRNIVIVDTPGFDDSRSEVTDTDILKKITTFLLEQYDKQRKLNGLVFLQRISDPRFGGQSGRNLRMFKGLCGSENYENVVVLTTNWDRVVNKEEGDGREAELKNVVFKELVDGGAKFMRHKFGNMKTARDVLEHIFTLLPTHIAIQKEIRVEGKVLEDTAAGSVHRDEIEQMIAKHKEELASLRQEMKANQAENAAERQELKKGLEQLNEKLERREKERLELKEGLEPTRKQQLKTPEESPHRQKPRNKFLGRFF